MISQATIRKMRLLFLALVYIVLATINGAALNAMYRSKTCVPSFLLGFMPPMIFVTPAATGLYASGLSFSCRDRK